MKQIIKVCEKMRHSLEKLSGYVPKTETTEDKVDDNPTLIQDTDTEE
jgi:hypothetical protein